MSNQVLDISNQQFGRLVVVEYAGKDRSEELYGDSPNGTIRNEGKIND